MEGLIGSALSPLGWLDPLFRLPFLTGLALACALPALGALLMLREEWLAALGLAHLAAASALLGLAAGLPAVIGGTLGALGAGLAKSLLAARGNAAYAFMILIGWSSLMLIAANTALGDALGHALMDGQLYFGGWVEFATSLMLACLCLATLPWLGRRLLRARFFPRFEQANRLPAWRWHLGMDLLSASGVAVGTATLGLMGAFALVLVPAWLAFRLARGWRATLAVAIGMGVAAYLLAFWAALAFDQPFGPVLVAVLIATGTLGLLPRIDRRRPGDKEARPSPASPPRIPPASAGRG